MEEYGSTFLNRSEQCITKEQSVVLKGIAILSVICTHANGYSKSFDNIPILKNGVITSILCQGGMCLFLILSGYGLFASLYEKGMGHFWEKRFKKIFFPVIIAQFGWFFIQNVRELFLGKNILFDGETVFGNIICTNNVNGIDASMWYMSFLLFCYLFFYCIFGFIKNTKVAIIVFSIFWVVLMPIMPIIWKNSFYCISSFAIGVLWAYVINQTMFKINLCVHFCTIIIATIIGIGYYFYFRECVVVDNIASNIIAILIIILVGIFNLNRCKFLQFIGKHSFSIYIFQGKIIFGWFPYQSYSSLIRFLVFVLLFIVNILVAYFFDCLINCIVAD